MRLSIIYEKAKDIVNNICWLFCQHKTVLKLLFCFSHSKTLHAAIRNVSAVLANRSLYLLFARQSITMDTGCDWLKQLKRLVVVLAFYFGGNKTFSLFVRTAFTST